jgi:hypothetical protein
MIMTYEGFINKSRTYDLAAVTAILTAIQPFIPQLELTQNQITIAGMILAGLIAYFRKITTGPVGEK